MQPNRTIMDWTVDIRAFAEGMKLDRFAIIGGSGGGPYALACAHALPREMVAGVGLFASAPPWAAGAHHMSRAQRAMCWMAMNTPGALSAVMRVLPQTWESEEAEAKDKKVQRDFTMNLLVGEPMRQGVDAAVDEARLLSAHDWGFHFEDVGYNQDRILGQEAAHCTLRAFSDDTHFTMLKRLEVALDDLFPKDNRES
ncbi:unnamed protein product, partial [Clonostachys rosea f. rosea IK726]